MQAVGGQPCVGSDVSSNVSGHANVGYPLLSTSAPWRLWGTLEDNCPAPLWEEAVGEVSLSSLNPANSPHNSPGTLRKGLGASIDMSEL